MARRVRACLLAAVLTLHVLAPAAPQTTERTAEQTRRPLPDDLPTLRWKQTASVLKCCAEDEALVRPEDGGEPDCRPVAAALRWRPLLLNGRTKQRAPPDRRTTVRAANLSCEEHHFWLDGGRPEQSFDLLTTGHLYLHAADALFPAGGFCADRLLPAAAAAGADPPPPPAAAARVCNISLHQASSLLDPDSLEPACRRHLCVRKCCPRGLQVRVDDLACVPQRGPRLWRPTVYDDLTRPQPAGPYLLVPGNPICTTSHAGEYGRVFDLQPAYTDDDIFYLQRDGRLWVPKQRMLEPENFCVDQARYVYNDTFSIDYDYAIACFGKPLASVYVANYVYSGLLVVSSLFLLATFAIYAAIPELQNVHGRCLLSHVAALFTAYVCILSGQTHTVYANMAFCQVTAIVMYYSFLAVCFWLNTMSFDIWWTFSQVRSTSSGGNKTKRFMRYSAYSWLCPLLLTAVTVFMQYAPDDLVPPEHFIRPGLGIERCWFRGSWEMLAYLHGPVLVLMTSNLIFFVLTARSLFRTEKDTQMVRKRKTGVERLKIYVNLFIVMGITWIAEALSIYLGPKYLWYVTDVIDSLQGFFIFLLFTMRGRTRKVIRRHLDSWGILRWCRWCRCCCRTSTDGRTSVLLSGSKTRTTSLPTGTSTKRDQCQEEAAAPLQA